MQTNDLRRVGRLIKAARAEEGMTQAELADRLGVSVTTVSDYERGLRQRLSRADVIALEESLGLEDRRLMVAVGYDRPEDGDHTLTYNGEQLTAGQVKDVRCFIDWLRDRAP